MRRERREYTSDERDIYSCCFPTCNRKYRTVRKLEAHERLCNRRPGREVFKCNTCNQTFSIREKLSNHVDVCGMWFRCTKEGCNRKYRRQEKAEEHIKSCNSDGKFISHFESKEEKTSGICSKCGCTVESSKKKDTILCRECKTILMTVFVNSSAGDVEDKEEIVQEENHCVVCLDAQADHVIIPCGHANVCYECITYITHSKDNAQCPTCRTPITQVVKLFK